MNLKSGFLSLIGLPNAGKSSLLNLLVGQKIAIVSPKPQTTWKTLKGYVVRDGLELAVLDTPGLQEGTIALNSSIARHSSRALKSAKEGQEVVAFVIDATDVGRAIRDKNFSSYDRIKRILDQNCGPLPIPTVCIPTLNKVDLIRKAEYREQIETYIQKFFSEIFKEVTKTQWISTLNKKGIDEFVDTVKPYLPELASGTNFNTDDLTDQPVREVVSELIREQCFLQLGEEIPYSIAVEIEKYDETDPKCVRIEAVLHVEKDSQKKVVIGSKGTKIKSIGTKSRMDIESFTGQHVFLGLRVKVTKNWSREKLLVERFGYGS